MSAVEVSDLVKSWGASRAVDGVSFTAQQGELLVLLGPSGCGKSTTLRLIAGLEEATSGRIDIGGRDVTRVPGAQRGIAMVFQSYALFPHLDVADNITFGLSVRGVPAPERKQRLDRVVELLGLGGLLARKPGQLSGGQQQRVALGRALIAEAPVCLMDEPLSNLDAQLRQELRKEIRGVQQRLGVTMVYVTHDQTEAMSMADQVILLRAGRIEHAGTPVDLYTSPATLFTARFIGGSPMNLIDLADGPGGAVLAGSAGPAVLAGPGQGRVLGLRPEDLRIGAPGGAGVPATVTAQEYLGADTLVSCAAGNQTLAVRHPGASAPPPGTAVSLAFGPSAVHLYDKASGLRIEPPPAP